MVLPIIGALGAMAATDIAMTTMFSAAAVALGVGAYNDTVETQDRKATRSQLRKESKARMKKLDKALEKEINAHAKALVRDAVAGNPALTLVPALTPAVMPVAPAAPAAFTAETEALLRQQVAANVATQVEKALATLGPDASEELKAQVREQFAEHCKSIQNEVVAEHLQAMVNEAAKKAAKKISKKEIKKNKKKKSQAVAA